MWCHDGSIKQTFSIKQFNVTVKTPPQCHCAHGKMNITFIPLVSIEYHSSQPSPSSTGQKTADNCSQCMGNNCIKLHQNMSMHIRVWEMAMKYILLLYNSVTKCDLDLRSIYLTDKVVRETKLWSYISRYVHACFSLFVLGFNAYAIVWQWDPSVTLTSEVYAWLMSMTHHPSQRNKAVKP